MFNTSKNINIAKKVINDDKKIYKKSNEISFFNYKVKLSYFQPFLPKYIIPEYYDEQFIIDKLILYQHITNNLIKNIDTEKKIQFNFFEKIPSELIIKKCNFNNNFDFDICKIEELIEKYKNEIIRLNKFKSDLNKCIENNDFKPSHLIEQNHEINNKKNKVKNNEKDRNSYCNLNIKEIKQIIDNMVSEKIKKRFEEYYKLDCDSKYKFLDIKVKYIFIIIYNLIDKYFKSINYSIKLLEKNPQSIDFNNEFDYLTKINEDFYIDNNHIKINHKNILNTQIITKYLNDWEKCDFINISSIKNNCKRKDIIFN